MSADEPVTAKELDDMLEGVITKFLSDVYGITADVSTPDGRSHAISEIKALAERWGA